jgi:hypothetical protein
MHRFHKENKNSDTKLQEKINQKAAEIDKRYKISETLVNSLEEKLDEFEEQFRKSGLFSEAEIVKAVDEATDEAYKTMINKVNETVGHLKIK